MLATLGATPAWVWLLLGYLVWSGWRATRTRRLSPGAVVVLPAVFLALSARPFLADAPAAADSAPYWASGLAAGAAAGWALAARSAAARDGEALVVPGTWAVLAVSLAFFAVQYWLGYKRAVRPDALREFPVNAVAPLLSAAGAGFFAGRAAALLLRYRRAAAPSSPGR